MAFSGAFVKPFQTAFDRGGAAVVGNGLLNNLVAYWKLEEASGDALDAHTNGLTFTLNSGGNWPSAAGKIGTSRSRSAGYFSRSDDTYLSTGDVDFTIAGWMYPTLADNLTLIAKWTGGTNQREYLLYYNHSDHAPQQRMTFAVSSNGSSVAVVDATDFGAITLNAWYLVVAWHDAANNQIGISVNNTATMASYSAGVYSSRAKTYLGIIDAGPYGLVGRLDEIGFWKSAAGAGGVLSSSQRSQLYNAGAGLAYSAFTT